MDMHSPSCLRVANVDARTPSLTPAATRADTQHRQHLLGCNIGRTMPGIYKYIRGHDPPASDHYITYFDTTQPTTSVAAPERRRDARSVHPPTEIKVFAREELLYSGPVNDDRQGVPTCPESFPSQPLSVLSRRPTRADLLPWCSTLPTRRSESTSGPS